MTITDVQTGITVVDSFNCIDGDTDAGVQSRILPRGTYDVALDLKSSAGQIVSSTGAMRRIVSRRGFVYLGNAVFEVQSWLLHWSLKRANAVSCEEAGATTVRLVTRMGSVAPVNYEFPCKDLRGETTAIPVGSESYSVQVLLLNAAGATLAEEPPKTFVVSKTQRATIPPITFAVP
jgi:hypothetical protein